MSEKKIETSVNVEHSETHEQAISKKKLNFICILRKINFQCEWKELSGDSVDDPEQKSEKKEHDRP